MGKLQCRNLRKDYNHYASVSQEKMKQHFSSKAHRLCVKQEEYHACDAITKVRFSSFPQPMAVGALQQHARSFASYSGSNSFLNNVRGSSQSMSEYCQSSWSLDDLEFVYLMKILALYCSVRDRVRVPGYVPKPEMIGQWIFTIRSYPVFEK